MHFLQVRNRLGVEMLLDVVRVIARQGRQNSQFDFTSVAILLNCSDNFNGAIALFLPIVTLDNFAKGPLSKQTCNFISS